MTENSFLGQGWSFPPSFSKEAGSIEMVSNEHDIDQSLEILLSTSLGERVMQPDYGCNLKDYQFETLNNGMVGYLQDLVKTAILLYEPRIILEKVEVSALDSNEILEGRFKILVDYRIARSNSRYNFVYDFYLNEANESPR